ncbi:MAG TPA: phosphoribosylaminoimidazolesuccinocarboxamide synthase [Gracilimonas sp.]|uniref:phosphoribosylaminoimidazolesuccinocarboxamide synthase n=1 Tax=Gracilimonas sp. TaxID=1974203 RepID=UPI002D89ED31|nr:phosphoribosylaminoimidazolesuccinocarboxamide synthase [Gracilimonas sp.]
MSNNFSDQEALDNCITETDIPGLPDPYKGKVREVYELGNNKIGIVVTDRISAFDYIMKQAIPFKGQILNQLAAFSFDKVKDIVATHIIDVPHPNVTIAKKCDPIPIEVVIRGYLTGHAWRTYKSGKRVLCGVNLPEGLKEHDKFPNPILTPATKAKEGHDEDISEAEILSRNIVTPELWHKIREIALKLFKKGTEVAAKQGLILVDTKYEFGLYEGELTLIDEVHTTDSSRYFYKEGYEERQAKGKGQKQLSKEFLREWLMEHNFQGLEGQTLPDLPDEFRMEVFERYAELFEMLTGKEFEPVLEKDINKTLADIFS